MGKTLHQRTLAPVSHGVKDVDLEMKQITVRDGKGAKDRYTTLAEVLIPALREHLEKVRLRHQEDLQMGFGAVYLPGALDRKYPKAAREWRWQYIFPGAGALLRGDNNFLPPSSLSAR